MAFARSRLLNMNHSNFHKNENSLRRLKLSLKLSYCSAVPLESNLYQRPAAVTVFEYLHAHEGVGDAGRVLHRTTATAVNFALHRLTNIDLLSLETSETI